MALVQLKFDKNNVRVVVQDLNLPIFVPLATNRQSQRTFINNK